MSAPDTTNIRPDFAVQWRRAARRAEAGEAVALRAEEFLDQLEKRWPEAVVDMYAWRDALLQSISEMRLLP